MISHGSRNPDWVWTVDESICKLNIPEGMPLDSSFLEAVEGRAIQDGLHSLEERGVTDAIVVPLFISSASTHMEEIQYALGLIEEASIETDIGRMQTTMTLDFCEPIDDDPLIVEICYEKIKPLSVQPEREVLLMVGHGSDEAGFGDRWVQMLGSITEQVKQLGRFADADCATLHPDDIAAKVAYWRTARPEFDVIVAPFFLSEGYFTKKVIPQRIDELPNVRYNGKALLPHPNITRWMEKQIARFL